MNRSNIFNLLSGIAESDRGQAVKSVAQPKICNEIRENPSKTTIEGTKSKGLSLRSTSDMNISHGTHSSNTKKNVCSNNEKDLLKLKLTQVDSNGCPISPGKDTPAKKLITTTCKGISAKEKTIIDKNIDKNIKAQKILNDDVFKKPLLFTKFNKFPKPENLAPYYEDKDEYDYGHIDAIERQLKDLFPKRKENIVPYEEEFLSDPETLISSEIPSIILSNPFDEEYMDLSSPELPKISNSDDF